MEIICEFIDMQTHGLSCIKFNMEHKKKGFFYNLVISMYL